MKLQYWTFVFLLIGAKLWGQTRGDILDASEIIKLIPDRIKDFHLGTDAKSRVIKMEISSIQWQRRIIAAVKEEQSKFYYRLQRSAYHV